MITSDEHSQLISLSRDCDVISVPYGEKETLKEGTEVQIMQALGGSYTVYTAEGMFRINGINADAIGKEVEKPPTLPDNITDDQFEEKIWDQMKTVFDPEIPINVVDLGLIYDCRLNKSDNDYFIIEIDMTLTAPGCGMADVLVADIKERIEMMPRVASVKVELVLDPPWSMEMMSEVARLEAGLI
ncbi:MAG: putative Fe-S cluster assembly protein SufT [Gammaproteobacteria bacterium]|jgi:probable FeS assembly SUF system protein SufT|nr:putative Fe-S cluster assembly protein SufT [Gammaproteobacteria bacterium]MBQ08990.1 putative Fe-S cluster assembly protein SufT [Gammaproteobacteria bacterium]MDP6146911.1 putative Fe-S cluster assembly protein SufT [Gammaproteobacteria bacterium]HJL80387.1 putative Fe-S cluster assembly protein SufT [Gammaproteobacteria bacterium]HJM09580.1 putative Fe-S cluster assembly protein SufT [Gammaproteobacteria bacterium]|tara:strand:+ start:21390 stop:21947 length:558 start_codon:yes stop_codon:yes gene_type:complete